MCLWENENIIIGDGNKSIKIIDLLKKEKVKDLSDEVEKIITIKKIRLKKYGECLITQGHLKSGIKLWIKN